MLKADYNILHSVTCIISILNLFVVLAVKHLCFRIHSIYSSLVKRLDGIKSRHCSIVILLSTTVAACSRDACFKDVTLLAQLSQTTEK